LPFSWIGGKAAEQTAQLVVNLFSLCVPHDVEQSRCRQAIQTTRKAPVRRPTFVKVRKQNLHILDVGHFATLEVPGQVASLTADFVKLLKLLH
jgi:hypothetical protein